MQRIENVWMRLVKRDKRKPCASEERISEEVSLWIMVRPHYIGMPGLRDSNLGYFSRHRLPVPVDKLVWA